MNEREKKRFAANKRVEIEELVEELHEEPGKPYTSTVIGCKLRTVAQKCGKEYANEIVRDLMLTEIGIQEVA
jgi:hypothetical protein